MVKQAREDIIGRHCYEVSHHRKERCKPPHDVCPAEKVFNTGEPFKVVHTHFDREGNKMYIELTAAPIKDKEGNITQVIEISRDITERIKAGQKLEEKTKQLERSNKLKDLFTDIMRHDLLNPVGVIRNLVEMVREDKTFRDSQEIQMIEKNVRKLEEMIRNASKFAKLESAEKIEVEKKDLNVIFKDVIMYFEPVLKEKKMQLKYKAKGKCLAEVNPVIEDVFSNLLSNAIKFSPEKSKIVIDILDEDKYWKIMVKDYGIGIADENKPKIFERFKRIDKGNVKGTGLGLAIVKRIVDLHNGKVWVEDNPEGGSIFYVTIPKVEE
jgi:hypothetical protein